MPSFFKRSLLPKLRGFPLSTDAIQVLSGAAAFRHCLLEKIPQATRRIYIVALYLQQDEAFFSQMIGKRVNLEQAMAEIAGGLPHPGTRTLVTLPQ